MNNAVGSTTTGAVAALEGYFYQLDVSILTALELLLARQVARELRLEPRTQEDLESDIVDAPGALVQNIPLDSHHLIIQCKLTNEGPWKSARLRQLLHHHGRGRQSAASRLSDPANRYLLITNADVDGVARSLIVKDIATWPPAPRVPQSVARGLPQSLTGRLAVLSMMDSEKVLSRTENLLTKRFMVPQARLTACRKALQDAALLRMRGATDGRWTRKDLEGVILEHGGLAGRAEALERFVPPTNWAKLKEALDLRHAVIISGPSGTGKTRTAEALVATLREKIAGLNVVHVQGGPEKIRQHHSSPVVFAVEDPWGKVRIEPQSVPWNDSIDELLHGAGPDRKFIITSRSDVLRTSGPRSLNPRWVVHLEAEHYREEDRLDLFDNYLKTLPRPLQPAALRNQREAIDRLVTPLEMVRYFRELAAGPTADENEYVYIRRCLHEAQQGTLEHSILENVRNRDEWRWAAVVWGLFKARDRQSFRVLPLIQAGLAERDRDFEDGLAPYIHFLIAGRNLRQSEAILSYQHPRVELGLAQALQERPQLASRVLRDLVDTLIALDANSDDDWGREGAVHLMHAVRRQPSLDLKLSAATQAVLDAWLRTRLSAPGADFEDDLRVAASVGSAACLPAEVARWLTNVRGKRQELELFDPVWKLLPMPPEWYDTVRADPATRPICEAFIRRLLPHGRDALHRREFVQHLKRLAPDLAPVFCETALSMATWGYASSADLIAEGALEDLDGFEVVVAEAVRYEAIPNARESDDEWLAHRNGEYDDEHSEHFAESMGEMGHTAQTFIHAYVEARRHRDGWQALRDHSSRNGLLAAWIRSVRDEKIAESEWLALAESARHTPQEADFWKHAARHWRAALAPVLRQRTIDGGGDDPSGIAVGHAFALHLKSQVREIASTLIDCGNTHRVLELACDLGSALQGTEEEDQEALRLAIDELAAAMPPELAAAIGSMAGIAAQPPRAAAIAVIETLDAGKNKRLKLAQARALALAGVSISTLMDELLKPVEDSETEIEITTAAIEFAWQQELWVQVERALTHRFADVRKRALLALAARSTGPLPQSLLEMAQDKSHFVRATLADLLKVRRHPEHTATLILLAKDNWTPDMHGYHRVRYPIAREAARILREAHPLDDAQSDSIARLVLNLSDEDVARTLLAALIRQGSAGSRQGMMALALRTGSPPFHRLAAEAMLLEAEAVDTVAVDGIANAQLLRRVAAVALALTRLIGTRGSPARIEAAARALAADPDRRALLVPLYLTAAPRTDAPAQALLGWLTPELALALQSFAAGGPKLPRTALDGIGDVHVVEEILRSCPESFEPRRKENDSLAASVDLS